FSRESAERRRAAMGRLLIPAVLAGAGYSAVVGWFPRYSWPATIAVAIPAAAGVLVAWRVSAGSARTAGRPRRARGGPGGGGRRLSLGAGRAVPAARSRYRLLRPPDADLPGEPDSRLRPRQVGGAVRLARRRLVPGPAMSSHVITLAGYLAFLVAGIGLEALAHPPGSRIPAIRAAARRIMHSRTGRIAVAAWWAWLGLHLFSK